MGVSAKGGPGVQQGGTQRQGPASHNTPQHNIWCGPLMAGSRDALEGKGPQRRSDTRLEEVAEAVGGGYCRLQMPLRLALAVRETVAGHRLGAVEGGGGGTPPLPMNPCQAGKDLRVRVCGPQYGRVAVSESASCASSGAIGMCMPALVPRCSLALWTPQGCVYILVSGHSLSEVLLLAPRSAPCGQANCGP